MGCLNGQPSSGTGMDEDGNVSRTERERRRMVKIEKVVFQLFCLWVAFEGPKKSCLIFLPILILNLDTVTFSTLLDVKYSSCRSCGHHVIPCPLRSSLLPPLSCLPEIYTWNWHLYQIIFNFLILPLIVVNCSQLINLKMSVLSKFFLSDYTMSYNCYEGEHNN